MGSPSISAAGSGLLAALGDRSAGLAANRGILARHELLAEQLGELGRWEDAISTAAVGALVATVRHPGVLASPRLERVLTRAARQCLAPLAPRDRPASPRRVLHVVTEMYGTGGHTRVLWRWIARDCDRSHTVVTTEQRGEVVAGVRDAVSASGGELVSLNADASRLERARALRELASGFDLVVLHIHHHDPVPILAFAEGDRPPVILFNHADHMFWLGSSIVDLLYTCRSCPATELRGIAPVRCLIAPFPVVGPDGHANAEPVGARERSDLRAQLLPKLGWPEESCILLTIGHAHKYLGPPGTGLLDLIDPVLSEAPEARLLAVGPPDCDAFLRAREQTDGRVVALGPISGVAPLFGAADVYLESRPFGGQSASAEAAISGLPTLSHAGSSLEAALLSTAPIYGAHVAGTVAGYRRTLLALLREPELREDLGRRCRAAALDADRGFEASVELAYERAAELGRMNVEELPEPAAASEDLNTIVDFVQETVAAYHPLLQAERAIASLELAARSESIRALFPTLTGPTRIPEPSYRYPVAFAAPAAEPGALRAVIEEFRRLALAGIAERYVIALQPSEAELAVPVLESALADGPDIDVDLILDDEPRRAQPECSLEVVWGGLSRDQVDRPTLRCLPVDPDQGAAGATALAA